MKNILNKYKLILLISLMIIIIGIILIFSLYKNKVVLKFYKNNYYNFQYDSNWKIDKKEELKVSLKNKNKALFSIELVNIDEEYKYSEIDKILDELMYTIEKQNKDYKLIYRTKTSVTKNSYDGYKLLYESDENQTMVTVFKYEDKIIIFIYEAYNKYFDLLLDSVQNIIYNFTFENEKFNLSYQISLDTRTISYSENSKLSKKVSETSNYSIAKENYLVDYTIPSIFKPLSFDSTLGIFQYREDFDYIDMVTSIRRTNIYEYLDKEATFTIYSNTSFLDKKPDDYKNIEKVLHEISINGYDGYIYQVKYQEVKTEKIHECYYIVVSLNKNHILIINIKSNNIKIPKELIDSIKIRSVTNYSSYTVNKQENGRLISELKTRLNDEKYELITINLPSKYKEIDKKINIYEERNYGLNYDDDNGVFQYNIEYNRSQLKEQTAIDSFNSSNSVYYNQGPYKELKYEKDIVINDKVFRLYSGGYTKYDYLYNSKDNKKVNYYINQKILMYDLDSGNRLAIIINGNNVDIPNSLLQELVDFNIENKDM